MAEINKENTLENSGKKPLNFIEQIIEKDLSEGTVKEVHTRFPPEPNGYLHIGHAKSIILNYGLSQKYHGKMNVRFDDTNPTAEKTEFVDGIRNDLHWLGAEWDDREYYASNYFDQLYDWAVMLIKAGKAYVCDLTPDQMSEYRGTPDKPGISPNRDKRTPEENLAMFERMKNGEFNDNEWTLRAKIDMASPNMQMRDPVMYRILKGTPHHRTGSKWCIYPMYDYAHGQSDYIEQISHSICTLEFKVHNPLYQWFLEQIIALQGDKAFPVRPHQYEFARLNLEYTVMSKRKLKRLVEENYVSGWDDPRMPTVCGLRRRGYTKESLWKFAEMVGVAERDNLIELNKLEYCIREDLNKRAKRVLAVTEPLKVTITNYPDDQTEMLEAINNPENPDDGKRLVPFSKVIYIEKEDFMENPPKKYKRLSPGVEIRLRYAYFITCNEVIKDNEGNVIELKCTYDPATKGGDAPDGRKVKGTIHWVSAKDAIEAKVNFYDRLFTKATPEDVEEGHDFLENMNPESNIVKTCYLEPSLKDAKPLDKFQFERIGYFCCDKDSTPENLIFNRTVTLKEGKWDDNKNK